MSVWFYIGILTGITLMSVAVVLIATLRQLRALKEQIQMVCDKRYPNMILRVDQAGIGLKGIVSEINALLERVREENRHYIRQQHLLKSQISSISHDLRTPLTSVIGYLELAESETDPLRRKEYLDIVLCRAEILQTLIVEFYDISLLEDPDRKIQTEPLDPLPILENTILTFYEDFNQRKIDLALDLSGQQMVRGSRAELIRVYSNLLRNILTHGSKQASIQHLEESGQVRTVFKNTIKDRTELDETRVFERFYSGDPSRGKGTGIGLYTVKLLLEKMGHSITVAREGEVLMFVIEYRE